MVCDSKPMRKSNLSFRKTFGWGKMKERVIPMKLFKLLVEWMER